MKVNLFDRFIEFEIDWRAVSAICIAIVAIILV